MTKKKSIVSKLLLLVLLLTLVSCCFLGSTFARYTSGGTGSATVSVAKWDVSTGEGNIALKFDKLSPAEGEYDGSNPRTNETGRKLIATITNDGDVAAEITFTTAKSDGQGENPAFLKTAEGNAPTYGNGIGDTTNGAPSQLEAEEVFSIEIYYNATEDAANGAKKYEDAAVEVAAGDTLYVYANVVWTSDVTGSLTGTYADERDTWIGMNVATVNYVVSYTAVQASELPVGA